jgi:signal transduction histidine kinase
LFSALLAILVLISVTAGARAAEDVPAEPWRFGGFVGGKADHFVDPTGALTIDDVIGAAAGRFIPANGSPANHGAAKRPAALWLRLALPQLSGSPADNWTLSLNEARTRAATFFIVDPVTGERQSQSWRFDQPAIEGGAVTRYPVLQAHASALSGHTIYLRVDTRSSMRATLWLKTPSRFLADYAREALFFGAFGGLLLALTAYCVTLGLAMREVSLIALGAEATAIAAYVLGDRGFIETSLVEGATTLSRILSFGGTFLIYLTALIFTAVYLRAPLRRRWSRWSIAALGVIFFCSAILAVIDVVTDQTRLRLLSGALGVAAIASLLVMALATSWVQPRRAALYLLCWLPALAGGLLRPALDAFPVALSGSPLVLNAVYPGVAASMLLFAIVTSAEARQRTLAAHRELAASERRFHDYSLTASDDFWEIDRNGVVTRGTSRRDAALALKVGEPMLAAIAERASTRDRSGLSALEKALAAGHPFRHIRIDLSPSESDERHVMISGLPIADDSDQEAAWRGAVSDVTDEVRSERERGRERTMAALGVMVGSIAHEINNLLHPIVNLSRLATERLHPDEENARFLRIINDSGRRAGEIVANVLGLTRARADLNRAPFGQAVAEALVALETLGGAQVRIDAAIESLDGPEIQSTRAFQILSNLISNAARAMNYKGVVVVRYRELEAEGARRRFRLTVSDSGVGMSESARSRALDPLFTAADGGSGLGLSIVRTIIESMGGQIDIESRLGLGATIAITLSTPKAGEPIKRGET